jgi:regulator of protease activity HflC (stomatin/prohibitin superfamily)
MDIELNPNKYHHKTNVTKEIEFEPYDGCCFLICNFFLFFGSLAFIIIPNFFELVWLLGISIPLFILSITFWFGFFTLKPNEAAVMVFYGNYKGTVKKPGFFWCNPLMSTSYMSLRSRNLNGEKIKVNDKSGNPIEIAIVVVWGVTDTARATFDVDNYENFVVVNSESAVRHVACAYPYDKVNDGDICLRSGSDQIVNELVQELHRRLEYAGIDVQEARITHLAYAPEIASAMLRRQQAEAIIAAREKIVQGAVSIVGHAISSLEQNSIVKMSNEEKAKLVSNMLVVLCSESQVHPVVNTG